MISSNPSQNMLAQNGMERWMKTRWKAHKGRNGGESSWWDMRKKWTCTPHILLILRLLYTISAVFFEYRRKWNMKRRLQFLVPSFPSWKLMSSPPNAITGDWTGAKSIETEWLDLRGAQQKDVRRREMTMEGKRTALLIYISVCMYGYINMPGVLGFENVRSSTAVPYPQDICAFIVIFLRSAWDTYVWKHFTPLAFQFNSPGSEMITGLCSGWKVISI